MRRVACAQSPPAYRPQRPTASRDRIPALRRPTLYIPESGAGSLMTILGAVESARPLKTNGSKKRRNHRQKSSFIVKTGVNPLNSLNNQ